MNRISRAFWIAAALCATVYGAAKAQDVTQEAGTNRRGSDYSSFEVRDLRECQRACERDNRCQAYTYYEIKTTCFLKDRVPKAEKERYQTSGVKQRGGGGGGGGYPGNGGGGLSEERGVDYRGGDYDNFRTSNLSACQEECRRERRCVAYTFYFRTGACYLKDRLGNLERNKDTITGRKRR